MARLAVVLHFVVAKVQTAEASAKMNLMQGTAQCTAVQINGF